MDKSMMEKMLEEYVNSGYEKSKTADHYELRRLQQMVERLHEELDLYGDFQLWLKFTHPDILDQYRCVKDIKERANESS